MRFCAKLGGRAEKSSTLRALVPDPNWFTDHIPDLANKDAALQIQGKFLLEHAEMATLNRTDANRAKAFISIPVDRFRPPFGMLTDNFPRQCVFVGTVNHTEYLRDETGARRFWPVLCGAIDVEALARDRDQLWAEAKQRYSCGEK